MLTNVTDLLKFKKYKEQPVPELTFYNIQPHKQHWEYKVVSNHVYDPTRDEEFVTVEHALQQGADRNNLILTEETIPEGIDTAFRYEFDDYQTIDRMVAISCNLFVIEILKGEHIGKEFLYPSFKCDIGIAVLCYGFLAHNYMDKNALKLIMKDEKRKNMLHFFVGGHIYEQMMDGYC